MTAHKSQPCFWSGFSVHTLNETSAFSLMPKVIWQTEFEKRTFLLLLCKAHMLHKYYLASPWCFLCALCFIIIATAISIKMLFSSLFFFSMLWLSNFILIHSSKTLQTNKMLHRILQTTSIPVLIFTLQHETNVKQAYSQDWSTDNNIS